MKMHALEAEFRRKLVESGVRTDDAAKAAVIGVNLVRKAFGRVAANLVANGTSYRTAARLMNIGPATVMRLFHRYGNDETKRIRKMQAKSQPAKRESA